MITGVHTMFYSSQAAELRAFFRDKLRLPYTDVGDEWLIFDAPSGDVGVHPADESQPHSRDGTHNISFFCDDIAATVAELETRGVEFTGPPQDQGFGLVTFMKAPGNLVIQLYQPSYAK